MTYNEKVIFDEITKYIAEHKYPPTVRELCKATGVRSTCTIHRWLKSMEQKGYIEITKGVNRALRIKEPTADMVEVVRCKDCACYFEFGPEYTYKGAPARYCAWHNILMGANDFCSSGMKKEV